MVLRNLSKAGHGMRLGQLELNTGAALAPMAGATDAVMRRLCAEYGAVCTVSEMISAKALTMGDRKSIHLMEGGGGNAPFGVQLFGAEPETMAEAARIVCGMREKLAFDFIDLNMGCPAPKITGSGAGSALLKDPPRAGAIARAVRDAVPREIPVTAKLRIGWDAGCMTGAETARRCAGAGLSLLTVHGRTRAEQYEPGIHAHEIAKIRAAVPKEIPVLANGDVTSAEGALALLDATGCDGVAVGRGAMGDPWLFARIAAAMNGGPVPAPPALAERFRVLRRHIYEMCEEKGEFIAMQQARSHAGWYMRGLRGAASLRRECCALRHFSDLDVLIERAWALQNTEKTGAAEP